MPKWTWTCRPGFEADLIEELTRAKLSPRPAGPALVASEGRPRAWPCFARAGFPVHGGEVAADAEIVAGALADALDATFAGKPKGWLLAAWVPDDDATNPLAPGLAVLEKRVIDVLEARRPDLATRRFTGAEEAKRYGAFFAQLALVGERRALVGVLPLADVPSLAPGGRARATNAKDSPSRAGRKLVEALEWFGRSPEAGDVCVDLGAAPGGWSAVLLERRARVIAVDPARLTPDLQRKKGLTHVMASAFDFVPTEPVDWLFCDMAWRPLEVAQLLAKWARRRLATALISNIKLPMKQRVEHVEKVVKIVGDGGWRDVKARQLYHDREEVTISAWRT